VVTNFDDVSRIPEIAVALRWISVRGSEVSAATVILATGSALSRVSEYPTAVDLTFAPDLRQSSEAPTDFESLGIDHAASLPEVIRSNVMVLTEMDIDCLVGRSASPSTL
jgi:hypothetical protein